MLVIVLKILKNSFRLTKWNRSIKRKRLKLKDELFEDKYKNQI